MQAVLEDDINQTSSQISEGYVHTKDLAQSISSLNSEIKELEKGKESFLNNIVNSVFSNRAMDQEELFNELTAELAQKEKKLAATKEKIIQYNESHDALVQPLQKLELEITATQKKSETLRAEIHDLRTLQLKEFCQAIAALPSEERQDIFRKLKEQAQSPEFFELSTKRLTESLQQCVALETKIQTHRQEFEQNKTASFNAMNEFSNSLSSGFKKNIEKKHVELKLDAKVYFKEEDGFFGFSNADGHASGKASANVIYNLESLKWQIPTELSAKFENLLQSFHFLGQNEAEILKLEWQQKQLELSLKNEVQYFRRELERDFYV